MSELTEDDTGAVRDWLRRNQFENVASMGGDSAPFGDRQEVWERDGTLIRLARDRGQWWYDLSRTGAGHWLDVDGVAGAMGSKSTAPVERVADVASIDDRKFSAISTMVRDAP
jgi:hypothetical protein